MNAKKFSSVMKQLAAVPSRASRAIAADISKEIQANFDRGCDPYRKPWKKLAKSTILRGRHPPPLTDTRKGRTSIRVTPTAGAGLRLTVGVRYMIYHQFGSPATKLPRRMFVPTERMPAAWAEIIMYRLEQSARGVLR